MIFCTLNTLYRDTLHTFAKRRPTVLTHSLTLFCIALIAYFPAHLYAAVPAPQAHWQDVIRKTPLHESQGMFENLTAIRRWILTASGYCSEQNRHILFDRRATFLGYFSNPEVAETTQALLNAQRSRMAEQGRVQHWAAGNKNQAGYPFALNCDQPDANLEQSLSRFTGQIASARLWGTWDGMRIGSQSQTVSLMQALTQVYDDRSAKQRISLPRKLLKTLTGKILIESGGRPRAHSNANAKGIMQLSPSALKDCGLAKRFHYHRMAQIDCALKLLAQNHRVLEPEFSKQFGHIPEQKRQDLYAYLLIQAYHGGVGRVIRLLKDPKFQQPALHFARHHSRYSAGDIALGMVFHNLGRNRLGFSSLYYVVDVSIASEFACHKKPAIPGCQ